jgi:hypothetical protein
LKRGVLVAHFCHLDRETGSELQRLAGAPMPDNVAAECGAAICGKTD